MNKSQPRRSRSQRRPLQPATLAQKQSAFTTYLSTHFPLPALYTCQVCHSALPTANLMCPSCSQTYCTNCIQTALQNTQKCPNCKATHSIDNFVKNRMLGNLIEGLEENKEKWKSRLCDFHPEQELTFLCEKWDLLACGEWVRDKCGGHGVGKYEGEFGKEIFEEVDKLEKMVEDGQVAKEKLGKIQEVLKERQENIKDYKERIVASIEKHEGTISDALLLVKVQICDIDEEVKFRSQCIQKLEKQKFLNNNFNHKGNPDFESIKKEVDELENHEYNQVKRKIVSKIDYTLGSYYDHSYKDQHGNSKVFLDRLEKEETAEFIVPNYKIQFAFDQDENVKVKVIRTDSLHNETSKMDISVAIKGGVIENNLIERSNAVFEFDPTLNLSVCNLATIEKPIIESWISDLKLSTCPSTFTIELSYKTGKSEPKVDTFDPKIRLYSKVRQTSVNALLSLLSDIHNYF